MFRTLASSVRKLARLDIALSLAVLALFLFIGITRPAHAMKITSVKSPGGIEAWFVQDATVPLVAMEYAFAGGSAQDPADKSGVGYLTGTR